MGVSLDELVAAAGGYVGTPLAFSPGGASSGLLPMTERHRPLDFAQLAAAGSMLGSAGVVVLADTVDLADVALWGLQFFEHESCGQCAPCRIGTRWMRQALERYLHSGQPATLRAVDDVAWEMREGSICGLGMTAALPLTSALQHFSDQFGSRPARVATHALRLHGGPP
jgi:NADH:ubiquinone oxidoreductase subunit F (NADH-binding)